MNDNNTYFEFLVETVFHRVMSMMMYMMTMARIGRAKLVKKNPMWNMPKL